MQEKLRLEKEEEERRAKEIEEAAAAEVQRQRLEEEAKIAANLEAEALERERLREEEFERREKAEIDAKKKKDEAEAKIGNGPERSNDKGRGNQGKRDNKDKGTQGRKGREPKKNSGSRDRADEERKDDKSGIKGDEKKPDLPSEDQSSKTPERQDPVDTGFVPSPDSSETKEGTEPKYRRQNAMKFDEDLEELGKTDGALDSEEFSFENPTKPRIEPPSVIQGSWVQRINDLFVTASREAFTVVASDRHLRIVAFFLVLSRLLVLLLSWLFSLMTAEQITPARIQKFFGLINSELKEGTANVKRVFGDSAVDGSSRANNSPSRPTFSSNLSKSLAELNKSLKEIAQTNFEQE